MPLRPVDRRSVPDAVANQLMDEILGGGLGIGEALPSERTLAELLGVSRPTVRAALQRLADAGMVEIRQGGATTVRDYRSTGGLDLLPSLISVGGQVDTDVALDIVEARQLLGPVIASQAARGMGGDEALGAAIASLESATDPVAQQHAALAFWDAVVDAADSVVFRLLFNGLKSAYEPLIDSLSAVLADEVSAAASYHELQDAIREGDVERAAQAASDVLAPGGQQLRALLQMVAVTQQTPPRSHTLAETRQDIA